MIERSRNKDMIVVLVVARLNLKGELMLSVLGVLVFLARSR